MGDQQEVEDQSFKKILAENKILPEKKTFVVISVAIIIVLFILTMINIRDTKGVYYLKKDITLTSQQRTLDIPIDLSWCNTTTEADSKKNLYVYFGNSDSFTDLHMVVRFSYSATQLQTGEKAAFSECEPIVTFGDVSRLFGRTISSPLFARSEQFKAKNSNIQQSDVLYPCGFRTLTAVQRRRK